MLYIVRTRPKESVGPSDLAEINALFDRDIIPTIEQVDGVRSSQAYNSITGEIVVILDIEDLATIDRVLADEGCQAVFGRLTSYTVRTGGEVLYDRPVWQRLYGQE